MLWAVVQPDGAASVTVKESHEVGSQTTGAVRPRASEVPVSGPPEIAWLAAAAPPTPTVKLAGEGVACDVAASGTATSEATAVARRKRRLRDQLRLGERPAAKSDMKGSPVVTYRTTTPETGRYPVRAPFQAL